MINPITVENELPKMTTDQLRELQDVVNQDINAAFKKQDAERVGYLQDLELRIYARIDFLEFVD